MRTSAAKLVGKRHEQVAADAGLQFSSVMSGLRAFKERLKRVRVLVEQVADGDELEADAEVGSKCAAVVDGALRRVGTGHADAEHVFRAEGVGGDGGDECGVDAAAQGDEGFAEAAFAHVIACAEHQRAIGGLGVVLMRIRRCAGASKGSTMTRSSSKDFAWAISSPWEFKAREEPSKMRLSLPPTWLHMRTGI